MYAVGRPATRGPATNLSRVLDPIEPQSHSPAPDGDPSYANRLGDPAVRPVLRL